MAAVEFAIILPLLLLFIFGIIEFSLFLYNKQVITNAAREGARRGVIVRSIRSVGTENAGIKARVMDFAKSNLVTFGDDILTIDDVKINPDADGVDDPVRELSFDNDLIVWVTYEYQFLFLSTIKIGPINLQSVSTMKME